MRIGRRAWLLLGLSAVNACGAAEADGARSHRVHGSTGAGATTSTATAGAGGGGGTIDEPDNGMPSDVYPAFQPALPKLYDYGGPVVAAPTLVPVTFANDDSSFTAMITDFTAKVGATAYFAANTAEYGIGPATAGAPVLLQDVPTGMVDDADIQAMLEAKLNGDDPAFPKPDPNTIFVLAYPSDVTITSMGGVSCWDFGGYHNSIALDSNHEGVAIPYVVVPRCKGIGGMSDGDTWTSSASHEIIEAVTDPYPTVYPAYGRVDLPDYYWKLVLGGEACDLCAQQSSSFSKVNGVGYMVQRCWSNKAAAALHDPCEPGSGNAYFNSAPLLPDTETVELYGHMVKLKSVKIAVGETKDVEIDLFSDQSTVGAWTVTAENVGPLMSAASDLELHLDRDQGRNGEKLHLSVHVLKPGQFGFETFLLRSRLGNDESLWVGAVTN